MNAAVRYQSKSGNTKKVAELIANALDCSAQSVQAPLDNPVDVLFVGGAVYAGMLSGKLKRFLKNLPAGHAKKVAVFSTTASDALIRQKVEKLLDGKEFSVLPDEFHVTSADLKNNETKVAEDAEKYAKDIIAD